MIPFGRDLEADMKHGLKQVGKKYIFTVKNLNPEDAGIYQVDVEGVNVFSTDFKSMFHSASRARFRCHFSDFCYIFLLNLAYFRL